MISEPVKRTEAKRGETVDRPHYKLMIPGPIEMEPEILAEMGKPLAAHYGPEWARFYRETVELMKKVMLAERARLFLLAGPGTAAIEMALGGVLGDGKKALIATNGFFGDRLIQIAQAYTPHVAALEVPWGDPIDPQQLEEALKKDPGIRAVALVHCETSTGVLNPLKELAEVCRKHGVLCLVDAVSSLGGAELRFDEWGLGAVAAATQKGLECPPGLAPVAFSPEAWEVVESTQTQQWYLSPKTWAWYEEEWGEWHPHPTTMPSGLMSALHLSLTRILEEGLDVRWARHDRVACTLRRGLQALGFAPLARKERYASPTVTAMRTPEGVEAGAIMSFLKEELGVLIGGGLGPLKGRAIRVGHMGPTARMGEIVALLYGVEEALRRMGRDVEPGRAFQALSSEV